MNEYQKANQKVYIDEMHAWLDTIEEENLGDWSPEAFSQMVEEILTMYGAKAVVEFLQWYEITPKISPKENRTKLS